MDLFPKYGSIENLYKKADILEHNVVVTEKLHGTNARIMWCEANGLVVGGRNSVLFHDNERVGPDGHGWVSFVQEANFEDKLKKYPNYVFCGEFYGGGIQKGVTYTLNKAKDFRVFDIRDDTGEFLDWNRVKDICEQLNIRHVPILYIGKLDLQKLENYQEMQSVTAFQHGVEMKDNIAEGVVIKTLIEKQDRYGQRMITKFKSDRWKENASLPKIPKDIRPEIMEMRNQALLFAKNVVTEGRLHTIIDHITREGNTEVSMQRTGDFLRELVHDIWEEHGDTREELDVDGIKAYSKAISTEGLKLWKTHVQRIPGR